MNESRESGQFRIGRLVLTTLVLAACQDLPTTAPSATPARDAISGRMGLGRDRFSIQCYVSRRVQGRSHPYEYGIMQLRFPSGTLAPDSSTRLFQYRIQEHGQDPLVAGACRIPNTPEAVEYAMKRLHLDRPRGRRGQDGNGSVLQGCVSDGLCPIEGIVVVAPRGSGPGGPSGWGYGGGGGWGSSLGDNYEPTGGGDSWDPGPDGSYRPSCERDANGNCINRPVAEGEWEQIGRIIDRMRPNNQACAGAKAALQSLYDRGMAAGRFKVWDGYDIDYTRSDPQRYGENRYDENGVYIELDSYWLFNDLSILVHEGMHTYYNSLPVDNVGRIEFTAESFAKAYEDSCW